MISSPENSSDCHSQEGSSTVVISSNHRCQYLAPLLCFTTALASDFTRLWQLSCRLTLTQAALPSSILLQQVDHLLAIGSTAAVAFTTDRALLLLMGPSLNSNFYLFSKQTSSTTLI